MILLQKPEIAHEVVLLHEFRDIPEVREPGADPDVVEGDVFELRQLGEACTDAGEEHAPEAFARSQVVGVLDVSGEVGKIVRATFTIESVQLVRVWLCCCCCCGATAAC